MIAMYKVISVKEPTKKRFNVFFLWLSAETDNRNLTEDTAINSLLEIWEHGGKKTNA
jgi:hypothetical protein